MRKIKINKLFQYTWDFYDYYFKDSFPITIWAKSFKEAEKSECYELREFGVLSNLKPTGKRLRSYTYYFSIKTNQLFRIIKRKIKLC